MHQPCEPLPALGLRGFSFGQSIVGTWFNSRLAVTVKLSKVVGDVSYSDWWFTPGGRISKNEALVQALQRVAREELGLAPDFCGQLLGKARLMGAWDHFYPRQRLQRQRVNPLREPAALAATVLGRGGSSQAAHG